MTAIEQGGALVGIVDLEDLLKEVNPDNPVGDDLEYTPGFVEMEALANPGGDQSMVAAVSPAEAHTADWQGVRAAALELLTRTRDLRIAVYLVRSSLACDGLAGFAEAVLLLRRMLERFWDQVHPQLDAGDGNDPTQRVNTIAMLRGRSETLDLLVSAPLVASKQAGKFCFRDVQIATGELHPGPDDKTPPTLALIQAAFLDCELEELQATAAAINESLENVNAVDQFITERVESSQALSLEDLLETLKAMDKFVSEQLSKRGVSIEKLDGEAESTASIPAGNTVEHTAAGEILSREAAVQMMEKISRYYLAHEPSSPIPLLMQRAKRLSSMDFRGILEDLAPSAVKELQNIAGSLTGSKDGSGKDGS